MISLTKTSKIVGIIVGVLTIVSFLGSAAWAYNKNYVDGKMGQIAQKLDDALGRLDRIENKIDNNRQHRNDLK